MPGINYFRVGRTSWSAAGLLACLAALKSGSGRTRADQEVRRTISLTPLLVAAFFVTSLFALDLNSLKPQGYVSAFAHALDEQSRSRIEAYCGRVEQVTGVQMAIVTIDSLDGQPVEDAANTLYRKWGVGKKGKNEGIMLLVAIKDHRDRIEVGYGLEPILPDGFVGGVLREFRPLMQQGAYGQAMLAATEEMGSRIATAKGVTLDVTLQQPRQRVVSQRRGIPFPLIVIGGIILLLILSRGGGGGVGGLLTGMFLGNLLGRGGGGSSWGGGGGFGGGGGGGGGFGGFGGGDSGGGGASGDW